MRIASFASGRYDDEVERQQANAGPSRRRQSCLANAPKQCTTCVRSRRALKAGTILLVASVLVVHPSTLFPCVRAAPASPPAAPAPPSSLGAQMMAQAAVPAHAASALEQRAAAQRAAVQSPGLPEMTEELWQRARVEPAGTDEAPQQRRNRQSSHVDDQVQDVVLPASRQVQGEARLEVDDSSPTRTALLLTATTSGRLPASAFTSGLISTWRPATRSVWFQKKAVIITAVFLAIFIVLIIGAAVFLRDRADDEEEDERAAGYGDLRDYDERAIERMRDERRMRSAGRGEDGKEATPTTGKKSWRKRRPALTSEKEGSYNTLGSGHKDRSSGDSTAVSRRLVTRWVKAPARRLRARRSNEEHAVIDDASFDDVAIGAFDGRAVETSTDEAASVRTHGSRRRGAPRLGDGMERVEIEYNEDTAAGTRIVESRVPNEPPPPLSPLSPAASSIGARTRALSDVSSAAILRRTASTMTGSAAPPSTAVGLDDSDFSAVEQAERALAHQGNETAEEVMPPAYISSRALGSQAQASSSSRAPIGVLASPVRALAGSEPPPHPSVDPALAGRGALDAKRADGSMPSDASQLVGASNASASALLGALLDADAEPSSGSATAEQQRAYAAHVATDDKAVLSALREAASAPTAGGPSAPSYDHDAISTTSPSSPSNVLLAGNEASAPQINVFEQHDESASPSSFRDVDASFDSGSAHAQAHKSEKGKMALPPPPSRAPYSRFDMPYASNEWSPALSSAASFGSAVPVSLPLPSAPPASAHAHAEEDEPEAQRKEQAAHARKRAEAEVEMTLRPSDPSELFTYDAALPNTMDAAATTTTTTTHLPAYERAPSAPSAPSAGDLETSLELNEETSEQPTSHTPSAPPL